MCCQVTIIWKLGLEILVVLDYLVSSLLNMVKGKVSCRFGFHLFVFLFHFITVIQLEHKVVHSYTTQWRLPSS